MTVRGAADPPASTRVTQPRQLALLCYLVLAKPRGLHARDVLVALLWPDHDETSGRQALRNVLHGLRSLLGPEVIISAGSGLVGIDPQRITCDALDLEQVGLLEPSDSAGSSIEPFHGFHVTSAPGFDQWLSIERDRLRGVLTRSDDALRSPGSNRHMAPREPRQPAQPPTADHHDAYGLYIRGHFLFLRGAHGGPPEELHRSREYFERALAMDESYAPAIAGLSNFYAVAARREVLKPFPETFAKAIEHSHRALALDPSLAIPHVHFGVDALYLKDDLDRAGDEFRLAASKDPRYPEARRFLGVWLGLVNRHDDALREMEAAALLEPDIPHMLSSLGAARLRVGDLEGAERVIRQTLTLDPRHAPARERLLRLLESQERVDEAMAERLRSPDRAEVEAFDSAWRSAGVSGYRRARRDELQRLAAKIEARLVERAPPTVGEIFSPPVLRLVSVYAELGEWKKAKGWRLQACAERPALARWFASLPEMERAP